MFKFYIICYFFSFSILGHWYSSLCGLITLCLHKISRRVCSPTISAPVNLGQLDQWGRVCPAPWIFRRGWTLRPHAGQDPWPSACATENNLNFYVFHQFIQFINWKIWRIRCKVGERGLNFAPTLDPLHNSLELVDCSWEANSDVSLVLLVLWELRPNDSLLTVLSVSATTWALLGCL